MAIAITIQMEGWESPEWVRDQLAPNMPGVDTMVKADGVGADVRIARLKATAAAREIAEYCQLYVLREHRDARVYAEQQKKGEWRVYAPRLTTAVSVAVLGLGHIGGLIARRFAAMDYRTIGWSRTQKDIDGVECFAGEDALAGVLATADFVISILPSTPDTRGLMNTETLSHFKEGSTLINVGRGDLVVDGDLLAALDTGNLAHAVLDVQNTEPLPAGHAYWDHAQVTITPHISGWNVIDGLDDIVENYRRMETGEELLHQVDRSAGY
ncbi:MAG: glyoxylate/hydroxypyruvate reductase A [Rhodospirillales bacterium]|nr:glyoxylate/hydroxypyruvate reductase A [Rhodospirillales bacterium]MBT4041408.1 glyoxylate/hydroxypyruvate reductase A [Rhodospirillales bacterium]MBT4628295.1 glyoxylate/hydroxypyruvate reductase A [Rhodospirillales bacterium]MBT5352309.1 glyoxylate/hydroxypyruvate reductase A [Rhodospirillales bacterium]MBT5521042.1 glyoxylate/hydroxypyruvate reductase A [Rhodospirillales bacterium]